MRESVSDIAADLGILEATRRWTLQDASWLFKALNKDQLPIPRYIEELIQLKEGPYDTRKGKVIDTMTRTKEGERSLVFRCKKLYDPSLWKCKTLDSFRRSVLSFL